MMETTAKHGRDPVATARELIDRAHEDDPKRLSDGRSAELIYADRMEGWVASMVPDASPLLRLAARCQHLERWKVPRDSFPADREGYNAWRRTLYVKQADRTRELLLEAGVSREDADAAATWVSKTGLRRNAGTQALEDAACLVFLEHEIDTFAADHEDYSMEKMLNILRRIWRKMSPEARVVASGLPMAPEIRGLLVAATEGVE